MASGGLAGRLVRLEARVMEAALAHTARRMADEHGVPVGECYAELRSLSQELAARVGRTSSRREQHAVIARRYGVDEADVAADLGRVQPERHSALTDAPASAHEESLGVIR